jgi:hypothetical protein
VKSEKIFQTDISVLPAAERYAIDGPENQKGEVKLLRKISAKRQKLQIVSKTALL